MSDATLNRFLGSGTAAQMAAFVPSPPTPASGPAATYIFRNTTDGLHYYWNGAAWVAITAAATPGGADKNVQYNNAGALGGVANNATATNKFLRQVSSGTPSMEQVAEADLSTTDITTNDVSSTKHGLAPKSPADATKFLNGAGTPAYAAVKDSDLSTSDITTNDVSTAKHGFVPKAPNDANQFLNGLGAWSTVTSTPPSLKVLQAERFY